MSKVDNKDTRTTPKAKAIFCCTGSWENFFRSAGRQNKKKLSFRAGTYKNKKYRSTRSSMEAITCLYSVIRRCQMY